MHNAHNELLAIMYEFSGSVEHLLYRIFTVLCSALQDRLQHQHAGVEVAMMKSIPWLARSIGRGVGNLIRAEFHVPNAGLHENVNSQWEFRIKLVEFTALLSLTSGRKSSKGKCTG